jgi:tripartite-type tricarboxylate transporter receptor subunit TctC
MFRRAALLLAICALPQPAICQQFPNAPIRYIVPYPPGGTSDAVARIVARKLSEVLAQPVIVENKPGAGATIGASYVAKSRPDGYTLLNGTTGIVAIVPHLHATPYDPLKDLMPVASFAEGSGALAVNLAVPANTLQEFIALAKSRPGKLNFGSAGNGTITHLFGEIFNLLAGVQLLHIPYRGSALALNDLLGGQIQAQFDPVVIQQARAGKVRALAALGSTRISVLPDVPTMAEAGLPEFKGLSWFGILAPAGTPQPIVERVAREIERIVAQPDTVASLRNLGGEPFFQDSQRFAAQIREDYATFGRVISEAGIKID